MRNWLLYVLTVAVWGTTWIAIEFQLGEVAPEVSVFYRYSLAALTLFAWCRWRNLNLRFDRRSHVLFVLLGTLLFSLNYIVTYYAQQYITSALTAIAFSTMLWMNIGNSRLFFGTRISASILAGSALGVAGILLLFLPEVTVTSLGNATLIGGGLALIGAFIASLGNMVSQHAQKSGLPIVQSNAWGMFYGALITGAIAVLQGKQFTLDTSAEYLFSLAYLSLFGSIIAFGSYLTLLGRIGAAKAGYAMVMFPVVAIAISVVFEDLVLTTEMLVGVVLVLLGNILILRTNARRPKTNFTADAPVQSPAGRAFRYVVQKQRY
jgi:drug/metabolite transporter (DMT)-like permease